MKLNACDGVFAVLECHDFARFGASRDFEASGQASLRHQQRMVAHHAQRIGQSSENTAFGVADIGGFAMHRRSRVAYFAPKKLPNELMPQAYAQNGDFPHTTPQHRRRYAAIRGATRTRRQQHSRRA